MKFTDQKGLLWALAIALISGVSVYVNKFGVAQLQDPFIYTTLKNSLVALGFLAAVCFTASLRELRAFTPGQWADWLGLGLLGGGIPFLLFFQGLPVASAPSAALIHKTLFIWVALLAVPVLDERLGWCQIGGLGILAIGQWLLQPPSALGWGTGELLIISATLLWTTETILAKKVLVSISAQAAALGRMSIGAPVMWLFLGLTGRGRERHCAHRHTVALGSHHRRVLDGVCLDVVPGAQSRAGIAGDKRSKLGCHHHSRLAVPFEAKGLTALQLMALAVMTLGAALFVVRPPQRTPQPVEAT